MIGLKMEKLKQAQEKDYKTRMGLYSATRINSLVFVSRLVALQIMPESVALDSMRFLYDCRSSWAQLHGHMLRWEKDTEGNEKINSEDS